MATGTCRNSRGPRRAGFTLIELIVMIIIILMITSIAVPAYSRLYSSSRFHQCVEGFASQLELARDLAVRNGTEVRVQYEQQSGVLHITADVPQQTDDVPQAIADQSADSDRDSDRIYELPSSAMVASFQVPQDGNTPNPLPGQNGNTNQELVFYEDGSSTGATVDLVSEDGQTQHVEVAPLTGRVMLSDENAHDLGG